MERDHELASLQSGADDSASTLGTLATRLRSDRIACTVNRAFQSGFVMPCVVILTRMKVCRCLLNGPCGKSRFSLRSRAHFATLTEDIMHQAHVREIRRAALKDPTDSYSYSGVREAYDMVDLILPCPRTLKLICRKNETQDRPGP